MRVYTRKSLYTRHLKEVSQEGTTKRIRQCPHREVELDEAFRIRRKTYEALWAIQVTQDQVDNAIGVIRQHNNGALPSRRRRTQNINGPELPEVAVLVTQGPQLPKSADQHLHRKGNHERGKFVPLSPEGSPFSDVRASQGFPSQQVPPSFGSQPSAVVYASTLPRSLSAPDLFPQTRIPSGYPTHDPMTDSPDVRTTQSFQSASAYQSQQDSSSLPGVQPPAFQRYLEVGTPLYNIGPPPRISGFLESQHDFIGVPTVDPHVLHQVSCHRHSSWDDSGVESNYDGTWTTTVRDQNYRHQMTYESGSQGYRDNYQYSTVSSSGRPHLTDSVFMLILYCTPRVSIFTMIHLFQLALLKEGDPAFRNDTERKVQGSPVTIKWQG